MNRKLQILLVGAVLIIAACVTIIAAIRVQEARAYSKPQRMRTLGGTNFVASLAETTIGRTESGRVVIASLVLENPNSYAITLERKRFVLVEQDHAHYQPSLTGTQMELIKIPAHGVVDTELLTFAVGAAALERTLRLEIEDHYSVLLKSGKPYTRTLNAGELRTFHRPDW